MKKTRIFLAYVLLFSIHCFLNLQETYSQSNFNFPEKNTGQIGGQLGGQFIIENLPKIQLDQSKDSTDLLNLVSVEAIAEHDVVKYNMESEIVLHFKIKKDWHIYWINAGDSGIPTEAKFDSKFPYINFQEVIFPLPTKIKSGTGDDAITDYVFENDLYVRYPFKIHSQDISGLSLNEPINIQIIVSYLVCKEQCIPGKDTINLKIDLSNKKERKNPKYDQISNILPQKVQTIADNHKISSKIIDGNLIIDSRSLELLEYYDFLPITNGIINNSAEQIQRINKVGFTLTIPLDKYASDIPNKMKGIFVNKKNKTKSYFSEFNIEKAK